MARQDRVARDAARNVSNLDIQGIHGGAMGAEVEIDLVSPPLSPAVKVWAQLEIE